MTERTQFTFYISFFEAISRIKKSADRAVAYDTIAKYALFGEEPDLGKLPDSVAIAYFLAKPTLDKSREKAMAGKRGGEAKQTASKRQANGKQTQANGKRGENASEKEKEGEKEIEKEKESYIPQTPFGRFWAAYPKKVGKLDAEKAFRKVTVPVERLLAAIEVQRSSPQWQKDGGQFIPNPSTWLNQGRWEDEVPGVCSSQGLDEASVEAIKRIMSTTEGEEEKNNHGEPG